MNTEDIARLRAWSEMARDGRGDLSDDDVDGLIAMAEETLRLRALVDKARLYVSDRTNYPLDERAFDALFFENTSATLALRAPKET